MQCNSGASIAGSGAIVNGSGQRIGTIKLFWSSACQSNWGQADFNDGNPASTPPVTVRVVGSSSGASHDNGPVSFRYTGSGSPVWGNMVYSPGCAYATVTRGDATGTAVQIGCRGPGGSSGGGGPPPTKCSGFNCTGQDPEQTACASDATTAGSEPIIDGSGQTIGELELRWSPTCQANWGRAIFSDGNPPSTPPVDVQVIGSRATSAYDESPVAFYTTGSGSPVYGNMIYSPGCAYAAVTRGDASAVAVQQGCPDPSSQPRPDTPYQLTANGYIWTVPGGQNLNGLVASFIDPDQSATSGDFLATIDWGDGTITEGTVEGGPSDFTVAGEHQYPDPTQPGVATAQGYDVIVTITDIGGGPDGGGGTASADTSVEVVGNDIPAGSNSGVSGDNKGWSVGTDGLTTVIEGAGCVIDWEVPILGELTCGDAALNAFKTGMSIADPPDPRFRHVFHAHIPRPGKVPKHCFHLRRKRCDVLYRAELRYIRAALRVNALTEDTAVTANRFGGARKAGARRYEKLQRHAERLYFVALRKGVAARRSSGRVLARVLQRFRLDRRITAQQIRRSRRHLMALKHVTNRELRQLRRDGLPATRSSLRAALRHALDWAPAATDMSLAAVLER
jgi:hypothetical protein